MQRRDVIKAMALLPATLVIGQELLAASAKTTPPANALSETEQLASMLKYKTDAKVAAERSNKKAFCHNCTKYNKCAAGDTACKPAAKGAAYAPCEAFTGKQVAKDGWCLAWAQS